MEYLSMTKDGRLLGPDGAPTPDALAALAFALALEEDCTLRSFFEMLRRYPDLQRLSQFLPISLAEADKCPPSGCRSDDITILVMGKTMELIGFPGKPRAELYLWLRGLEARPGEGTSADDSTPGAADADRQTMSLAVLMEANRETRFIPPRLLLDIPFVLGGLKHVVLGDVNRSLFCETRFTLFEVVDGLAWEFGFQGGTEQCSLGR